MYRRVLCIAFRLLRADAVRLHIVGEFAAAKFAVDVFSHMQEVIPREKELMKAMTDPEMVACMIGNVKVTAPGSTKIKQAMKKGKKASSKKE